MPPDRHEPRPIQWDELENLVRLYPIWPGDTISHRSMNCLADLGYAVRNREGNWIPTAAGLLRYYAGPQPSDLGT